MEFSLSDEQNMLRDTAERWLASLPSRPQADRALWREIADMGWLGAGFSEAEGGIDGGPVEVAVIMEMAGRALLRAPLIEGMVLGARLLSGAGAKTSLANVLEGQSIELPALEEPNQRHAPFTPDLRLMDCGGGHRLSGTKSLVSWATLADHFLISASDGAGSLVLLRVPADREGISLRERRLLDGGDAADLLLTDVAIGHDDILCQGNTAEDVLSEALDHATAALCAEAVGLADLLHERTLEYLKTREQFGQPIGSFQALQHRMVDLNIALEEARSLAMMANHALSLPAGEARVSPLSAAKQGVCARCLQIGREAIQLHGGIGMTEELPIGSAFRRLKALSLGLGDEAWHLERIADARGEISTGKEA
ncbi:Acyl-CoA dehydrogenase [Salinihabitans flavidus]|uniref:Acyl-CoA dehydrogenase n=1 Tax=Salinihabitans flavidus TaxID=569882 RepID=A0A1H8RLQ2_9RHOB|nr:acyl-CoA dehydrogenase [Salinihabitans flavidus]SEO67262.1 Acyl-CoA dehydrogenase [Salinihabitans flavidus]